MVQRPELVFFGDSLTEAWRGTDHCRPCNTTYRTGCTRLPALFASLYGRYHAAALGIAGDQAANLIWRLQHGQLPERHQPKVAVLLIGINDLGAAAADKGGQAAAWALAAAVHGVADRVWQAVRVLRHGMPAAHVVVLGLLPRGTGSGDVSLPVEQADHRWPSEYTEALSGVNRRLRKLTSRDSSGRVHFLDCSQRFLATINKRRSIDPALMPDALHPSAEGYQQLARCLKPLLAKLL
ncbi:hypothetical protein ABPG75_005453 [Micractinium tetrahymenae]